jgi:hypothetical protein
VVVSGAFSGRLFTATLTRAGAACTGTTKAQIFPCGASAPTAPAQNTLTIQLTVGKAAVTNKVWTVTSWAGTMKIDAPYTRTPDMAS